MSYPRDLTCDHLACRSARADELAAMGRTLDAVQLHKDGARVRCRWPYGPPAFHEPCCLLHEGGAFCDCKASDASDTEWGLGA